MKKTILLTFILLLVIAIVSCSTAKQEATAIESDASTLPVVNTEEEAKAAPTVSPVKLDLNEEVGYIKYSVSSKWRKVVSDDEKSIYYYFTDKNSDGFIMIYDSKLRLTAAERNDKSTMMHLLETYVDGIKGSGKQDFSTENTTVADEYAIKCKYTETIDNKAFVITTYAMESNGYIYSIAAWSSEKFLNESSTAFPSIIDSIIKIDAPPDFLDNEEIKTQLLSYSKSFKYEEIIALVDSYLKDNKVEDSDTAYVIKAAAEAARDTLPDCTIKTDDFNGESILYGGVDDISSDVNFVPFVGPDKMYVFELYAKIGFKQSDWLFFEKTSIKVADDNFITDIYGYNSVTRDVLYGGTILEEAETKLTAESIENILNAENPVIRFEGEDEKVRDHEMTESELNALDNVYKIASCNNLIERSIDDWEEANL